MTVLNGSAFRHLISERLQRISQNFSVLCFFGTFFTWNLPILAELLNRIIHGASQSEGRALFDDAVVWSRRVTGGCSRSLDQWQHSLQSSTPDTNSSRVSYSASFKIKQYARDVSTAKSIFITCISLQWNVFQKMMNALPQNTFSVRNSTFVANSETMRLFLFIYQKLVVLWKLRVTYQKGTKVTANVLKQCLTSNVAVG